MTRITGIRALIIALVSFLYATTSHASVVTLDFDTVAGGSNIIVDGSVTTSLGLITLFEDTPGDACIACFGTFPGDLPFGIFGNSLVEAGSPGSIGLDFSFDATEVTFNFGGDGGGFEIFALDIGGAILGSLVIADLPGSGLAPGPHTFSGIGNIRALRYEDPIGGAAIDNVVITSASVPEPSTLLLISMGIAGLGFVGRRKR